MLVLGSVQLLQLAAPAAISVGIGGSALQDFSTGPTGTGEFTSVTVTGGAGDITALGTGTGGVDNITTGVSATLNAAAGTALGTIAVVPATSTLNANVQYVSGTQNILTGPTGNKYQALVAHFTNNSGVAISSANLSFLMGIDTASAGTAAVGTEPLAGLYTFFSVSGGTSSWTTGTLYQTAGTQLGTLVFSVPVANGADFYVAWVDDNGPGTNTSNYEGRYTIDNVQITGITPVPEPSVVAMLGLGALFGRRKRQ